MNETCMPPIRIMLLSVYTTGKKFIGRASDKKKKRTN
jgi:hypothetical protein